MSNIVPVSVNLPSKIANKLGALMGGMVAPTSSGPVFPRISTNKSRFSIVQPGEGPVPIKEGKNFVSELSVIVLAANPGVYKSFYKNLYVPGTDPVAPACWSADGEKPSKSVTSKQSDSCASCHNNVFGSRVSETGAKAKLCGDSKRILVVAANDLDGAVYMVNISATALKTWNTYIKMLGRNGVYPQTVVTKLSFEEDVDYPKLEFSYAGTLDEQQLISVMTRLEDENVAEFIAGEADVETEFAKSYEGGVEKHVRAKHAEKEATTKPKDEEKETEAPAKADDGDVADEAPAKGVSKSVRSLLDF